MMHKPTHTHTIWRTNAEKPSEFKHLKTRSNGMNNGFWQLFVDMWRFAEVEPKFERPMHVCV